MRKTAFGMSDVVDGYEKFKQHPAGMISTTALGAVPGPIGGTVNAVDAANDFYHGRLASGALNTGLAATSLIPIPGVNTAANVVTKGVTGALGKVIPAGAKLTKAVENTKLVGNVAARTGAQLGANHIDQEREMQRPEMQRQMAQRQQDMRDFNEWKQHKQTLQSMNAPAPSPGSPDLTPGTKEAAEAPTAPTPSLGATIGHHAQNLGSAAVEHTGKTIGNAAHYGGLGLHHAGSWMHAHPKTTVGAAVALPAVAALAAHAMKPDDDEFVSMHKRSSFNLLDFDKYAGIKKIMKGSAGIKAKFGGAEAESKTRSKPRAKPQMSGINTPDAAAALLQAGTRTRAEKTAPKPTPKPTPKPPETMSGAGGPTGLSEAWNSFNEPHIQHSESAQVPPSMAASVLQRLGAVREKLHPAVMPSLAAGGLLAAGGGAYMLGRGKRNEEDELASNLMANKISADLSVGHEAREEVDKSEFAMPGSHPKGQSGTKGKYPMPDKAHERAALGFAAMHHGKNSAEYRAVAAKAHSLFGKTKTAGVNMMMLKELAKGLGNSAMSGARGLGSRLPTRDSLTTNISNLGHKAIDKTQELGTFTGGAFKDPAVSHVFETGSRAGMPSLARHAETAGNAMQKHPLIAGGAILGAGALAGAGAGYGAYRGGKALFGNEEEQ